MLGFFVAKSDRLDQLILMTELY